MAPPTKCHWNDDVIIPIYSARAHADSTVNTWVTIKVQYSWQTSSKSVNQMKRLSKLKDHLLLRSSSKKTLQFICCTDTATNTARAESHAREKPTASSSASLDEPLTPYQPTESSKLQVLQRQQGKRIRRFSPTWYAAYTWLTVCISRGKTFCVYCRYCNSNGFLNLAKKGEDAFVDTGFDNRKKALEEFGQHSQSDLHKEAVLKVRLSTRHE